MGHFKFRPTPGLIPRDVKLGIRLARVPPPVVIAPADEACSDADTIVTITGRYNAEPNALSHLEFTMAPLCPGALTLETANALAGDPLAAAVPTDIELVSVGGDTYRIQWAEPFPGAYWSWVVTVRSARGNVLLSAGLTHDWFNGWTIDPLCFSSGGGVQVLVVSLTSPGGLPDGSLVFEQQSGPMVTIDAAAHSCEVTIPDQADCTGFPVVISATKWLNGSPVGPFGDDIVIGCDCI